MLCHQMPVSVSMSDSEATYPEYPVISKPASIFALITPDYRTHGNNNRPTALCTVRLSNYIRIFSYRPFISTTQKSETKTRDPQTRRSGKRGEWRMGLFLDPSMGDRPSYSPYSQGSLVMHPRARRSVHRCSPPNHHAASGSPDERFRPVPANPIGP